MPASMEKVVFGPETVPGVQEPLPQLIASGMAHSLPVPLLVFVDLFFFGSDGDGNRR